MVIPNTISYQPIFIKVHMDKDTIFSEPKEIGIANFYLNDKKHIYSKTKCTWNKINLYTVIIGIANFYLNDKSIYTVKQNAHEIR